MSGFAGLFRRTGEEVSDSDLDAMTDALRHRGPHGRGTWRAGAGSGTGAGRDPGIGTGRESGSVGLGHQHLRTTPESVGESLPRRDPDTATVLTMDARIDNRQELIDALSDGGGLGGVDPATVTDGELILAAYDEWGVECFERLVGAFAVAVYDAERNRVVCARDHLGIKPCYYALADDLFAFGSEPKAILALPEVSARVDEASVVAFLADEFDDPEATFHERVARLPPATVMVVDGGSARKRSYWSLDPTRELDLPSDEAYEARFRELFGEAVRCRLRRPEGTTAGASLSGGLDSTSIACVAQSSLGPGESLRTFSVAHEGYPESDESEYVRTALDAYDFDARLVDGGGASPFLDLDERLAHHDAPFYPPLFVLKRLFADELADDDCRVLLDGLGGDQTLHYGTSHLPELLSSGRIGRFGRELDALADQRGESKRRLAFDFVAGSLAPRPVRRAWQSLQGRAEFEGRYPYLDAATARAVGFDPPEAGASAPAKTHREEHRRRVTDGEQTHFLEVVDAEMARLGVEPRYPFYDRRLVEFCVALPLDQKMCEGVGRQILRRATTGTVPESILGRTDKANLSESWIDGLVRHERDRLAERVVESPRFVDRYVDEAAVTEAFRRFSESPSLDDAWTLSKAYAAETWLRNADSPP